MTFTTLSFIAFLAIVFSAYWLLRMRPYQNILVVIASYVFYGWWDWRYCLMMAVSTCVDFFIARAIHSTESIPRRRALLGATLIFNLGVLAFFKYFNFFAESFSAMTGALGWHAHPIVLNIMLPVGISFYTFQTLSYSLDVFFRRITPSKSLIEYLAFVSFFPQLVAGPIERASHLLPQFQRERVFDEDKAVDGCRQILWGFFKKLAIADQLAPYVDRAYAHVSDGSGASLALATVFFAFQIYCDFSAYSDIAIGTARLFGFDIMRNFAYPYFSQDLGEFWRRWHISLSTWFRDYVYLPLGGNRVTNGRQSFNVLVTFAISGLWHGAAWQYVTWGIFNGVAVQFHRKGKLGETSRGSSVPGGEGAVPSIGILLRMIITFSIVCTGWVFFRADSVSVALEVLEKIATAPFQGNFGEIRLKSSAFQIMVIGILVVIEWVQRRAPHPLQIGRLPRTVRWGAYAILLLFMFYNLPEESSPFIYFQF